MRSCSGMHITAVLQRQLIPGSVMLRSPSVQEQQRSKLHTTLLPKTRRLLSVITKKPLLTLKNNELLKLETMMSDPTELKEVMFLLAVTFTHFCIADSLFSEESELELFH